MHSDIEACAARSPCSPHRVRLLQRTAWRV